MTNLVTVVFFNFWSSFMYIHSLMDLIQFSPKKKSYLKALRTYKEQLCKEHKSSWLSLLQVKKAGLVMQTCIKNFLCKTDLLRDCYHNVIYSIASRWSSGTPPVLVLAFVKRFRSIELKWKLFHQTNWASKLLFSNQALWRTRALFLSKNYRKITRG